MLVILFIKETSIHKSLTISPYKEKKKGAPIPPQKEHCYEVQGLILPDESLLAPAQAVRNISIRKCKRFLKFYFVCLRIPCIFHNGDSHYVNKRCIVIPQAEFIVC